MDYIPNTDADRALMLGRLGLENIDGLFRHIPAGLAPRSFRLPAGRSELEVEARLGRLAAENSVSLVSFLGAGFYDHFVPPVVGELAFRPDFYTAYTPYQAEISQGVLQALFEFQTAICELTGLDVANASLYDGGTALFEAVMMAIRATGRRKIVFDQGLNPIYRAMLRTHTRNLALELREVPVGPDGTADRAMYGREVDSETACLIVQNPNFFGCLDAPGDLAALVHRVGGLAVACVYPASLGLIVTPGEAGADIAVGEGQGLGLPLSFGGPYLGFLACRRDYLRQVPGRLVGRTVDRSGRPAFTLTLQTREQHIRREKATSNICSNETLCAIAAIVHLAALGRAGLEEMARLCRAKACFLQAEMLKIPGVRAPFAAPFFNEFTVELPAGADEVAGRLLKNGFAAGLPLGVFHPEMGNRLLVAVTEKRTREEMDLFVRALAGILHET